MLANVWHGRYPLRRAFWLFYVGGFFVCWVVVGIIYIPFFYLHVRTLGFIIAWLCFFFYIVVASVGVWRSAGAYTRTEANKLWPIAAKAVVCIAVARILWSLANGGAANILAHVTNGIDVGIAE
jgi:hypothetical protein